MFLNNTLKTNGSYSYRIFKKNSFKKKESWKKFYERYVYESVDDKSLS